MFAKSIEKRLLDQGINTVWLLWYRIYAGGIIHVLHISGFEARGSDGAWNFNQEWCQALGNLPREQRKGCNRTASNLAGLSLGDADMMRQGRAIFAHV